MVSKVILHFRFTFDSMHAVTGAYAKPIFVDKLGANPVCIVYLIVSLKLEI